MNSNYRLPLKHFEKRDWKTLNKYNNNLQLLQIWPIVSVSIFLIVTTVLIFIAFKSTSEVKNFLITPNINGTVNINKCEFEFIKKNNDQFVWQSRDCTDQNNYLFEKENKNNSTLVSSNPALYLSNTKTNSILTNLHLLTDPIIADIVGYTSILDNNKNYQLAGTCTRDKYCWIIKRLNSNNVEILNKNILNELINVPTFKSLELIDDNSNLTVRQNLEQFTNTYKLDLLNQTLSKQ